MGTCEGFTIQNTLPCLLSLFISSIWWNGVLSWPFPLTYVNRKGVLYHSSACCMISNCCVQGYCAMGGVCSRKRNQQVDDDGIQVPVSGRYGKIGSSKWLRNSFSRPVIDFQLGRERCPSLMELCIHKICEVLAHFTMFVLGSCSFVDLYLMPNLIFLYLNRTLIDMPNSPCFRGIYLNKSSTNLLIPTPLLPLLLKLFETVLYRWLIEVFCFLIDINLFNGPNYFWLLFLALQDVDLGEFPEVNDSWMDIISSQGLSLLLVDLSGSSVTDNGLSLLKDCPNIQAFSFNYCDQISESGFKNISGNTLCVCVYFRLVKKICVIYWSL